MKALRCLLAAAVALACGAAQAEDCTQTSWATAFYTGCSGSFDGLLSGEASELAAIAARFGGTWSYVGRSDDADNGPFTANPQVAFNGVLSFDEPVSGSFVLGIVSMGKYSFYGFNTKRRIGGLGFDSLEGVATTPQGNPFPLDYAVLFAPAPVPEPSPWLLLGGGLALMAWRRRR